MSSSRNLLKYICLGLAAVVVILLLVVAFLLGKQSGAGKNEGVGRTPSGGGAAVTETPAPLPDGAATPAPADGTGGEDTAATNAAEVPPAATLPDPTQQAAQPSQQTDTVPHPPADTTGAPKTLSVDMTNGSLTFTTGVSFDVKYDSSVIDVQSSGGRVAIKNDHSNPSAGERKRMDVIVTVPYDYYLEDVDISFGAGKLVSDELRANNLRLELGAGSATLDGLYVTGAADIKNGAGAFSIKSGALNNLTMQCGAGATQVKAALTGASRITAAVGAVDLQLDGAQSDYTVAFQMGLGACYFNNEKIARSGAFGSGPNRVDINGGFGVMRVSVG